MTTTDLREILVATARAYMGANSYNGQKQEIIDIYNKNQPRPRGYKVQYSDAWCATFVSAMGYIAGFSRIVFPECSCPEMITKYMFANCWEERDDYVPKPGDIIFYDWDDNGHGDCTGVPDHVGIVETCNGYNITVIEGNKGDTVGRRNLLVNSRYVRGYGVPNYSLLTDDKDEPETKPESEEDEMVYHNLNEVPDWGKDAIKALCDCGALGGVGNGDLNLNETLLRALVVMKRYMDRK
jgi:hypothetical protein